MKRLFTTLTIMAAMVLSLVGIETKAQTVTDINVEAYGNNVIVKYNLDKATDIDLYVSVDGGVTWEGPLKQVTGNVGKNVQPGSNVIMWDAIKERGGISGDDIRFDIRLPKVVGTVAVGSSNNIREYERIRINKISKEGNQCVVEYALYEPAYAIGLYYSEDNGVTWKGPAKNIEGDAWKVSTGKNKTIRWNINDELGSYGTTPTVKLEILRKNDFNKSDREKMSAVNSIYYHDDGKLYRKYTVHKWVIQPEIGVGCDFNSRHRTMSFNFDFLVGYQFTRPFGMGLKLGIFYGNYGHLPITLNFKGFLGERSTCVYYNVGAGLDIIDCQFTVSAEFGVALKNFNIGVEYMYISGYKYEASSPMLKFGYNIPLGKKK